MQLCDICNKQVRISDGIYVCERGHVMGNAIETMNVNARIISRSFSSLKKDKKLKKIKYEKLKKIPAEAFMFISKRFFKELNELKINKTEYNEEYYMMVLAYFLSISPDVSHNEMNSMMKFCIFLYFKNLFETKNLNCSQFKFPKKNKKPKILISDKLFYNKKSLDKNHKKVIKRVKLIEEIETGSWPLLIEDFEEFYTFEKVITYLNLFEKKFNVFISKTFIEFSFYKLSSLEIRRSIEFFNRENLSFYNNFSLEYASKSFDRLVNEFNMLDNTCFRIEKFNKEIKDYEKYKKASLPRHKVDVRSPVFIKAAFLIFYETVMLENPNFIIYEELILIFLFSFGIIFRVSIDFNKLEISDKKYITESFGINKELNKLKQQIKEAEDIRVFSLNIKYFNIFKIFKYFKITKYLGPEKVVFEEFYKHLIYIFNELFSSNEEERIIFFKSLINKISP